MPRLACCSDRLHAKGDAADGLGFPAAVARLSSGDHFLRIARHTLDEMTAHSGKGKTPTPAPPPELQAEARGASAYIIEWHSV
jgi:hypothetical protein